MSCAGAPERPGWLDAELAAALLAVDPVGLAGVVLRALPGPLRDRWLDRLRVLLGSTAPLRRVPLHVPDGRLLGGLDLAATLEAGRPVAERGILAESDGGVLLLPMAERLSTATAARLCQVLDSGEVRLERDGLAHASATRIGVVALDEGMAPEERPPSALLDRLALHLDLSHCALRDVLLPRLGPGEVAAARERLQGVRATPELTRALCECALALGIASIRAPMLALRVARAAAALAERDAVADEDAAAAARLVLAPRALSLPESEAPAPGEEPPREAQDTEDAERGGEVSAESLNDLVLSAAEAAIPPGLLARLRADPTGGPRSRAPGKAGVRQHSALRGRPAGVRPGEPARGARLDIIETLRAAAPWQRLRGWEGRGRRSRKPRAPRVEVRRDDFRVTRFRRRSESTTIFAVDASGSTALHRLAEAKGAVELLLAECYVRRDRVALVAFRGREAELILPPTRSLIRAKRGLAGLPGGGGTPLAAGLEAAAELADSVLRRGGTPLVVVLTDGHANVARDGSAGRAQAAEDAEAAGRLFRAAGLGALVIDTSPRPQPQARRLAGEMNAGYLPLPRADSAALCEAVSAAAPAERRPGP